MKPFIALIVRNDPRRPGNFLAGAQVLPRGKPGLPAEALAKAGSRPNVMPGRRILFGTCVVTIVLFLVSACGPTYKKESYKQSIKDLAKKDYKLDVEVDERGGTLGLRYQIPNLLAEMTSGDEGLYRDMNGLFMVLARVALSADIAPQFIVLDISDATNPNFKMILTRYVEDLRKAYAEALSYNQSHDRMLEEFVIGKKKILFDAEDMDLVRLMMMAVDTPEDTGPVDTVFKLEEVDFQVFLERVAENVMRRLIREDGKFKDAVQLRQVKTFFRRQNQDPPDFQVSLDLVGYPSSTLSKSFMDTVLLPMVAAETGKLFKSYKFSDFSKITVVEKNSGKLLILPKT